VVFFVCEKKIQILNPKIGEEHFRKCCIGIDCLASFNRRAHLFFAESSWKRQMIGYEKGLHFQNFFFSFFTQTENKSYDKKFVK
jgi:hypothetical protein